MLVRASARRAAEGMLLEAGRCVPRRSAEARRERKGKQALPMRGRLRASITLYGSGSSNSRLCRWEMTRMINGERPVCAGVEARRGRRPRSNPKGTPPRYAKREKNEADE